MKRTLVLLLALAPAAAGCLDAQADGVETANDAGAAAALPPLEHALPWEGHLAAGPLDRLAHQRPAEGLVAPHARMGFLVEVPEGTTRLRFSMAWPEGTAMHLMVHGPHEAGMPTYMGEWPDGGADCFEVPPPEVLPGTWRVMAHADATARDLDFTILVETAGPAAPLLVEGEHGHGQDDGGMAMEERDPLPCEA